jgi:hypothetical protein
VFQSQHDVLMDAAAKFERPRLNTAIYLTICIGGEAEQPDQKIDRYLSEYYGVPSKILRSMQACCGGTLE